jgi:hypothetical protein
MLSVHQFCHQQFQLQHTCNSGLLLQCHFSWISDGRKGMAPSTVTPSPVPMKKINDHKMPVEILVERLQHGSRHRFERLLLLRPRTQQTSCSWSGRKGRMKKRLVPRSSGFYPRSYFWSHTTNPSLKSFKDVDSIIFNYLKIISS